MATNAQGVQRLRQAEANLADRLAGVRAGFQELEQALRGGAASKPAANQTGSRVLVMRDLDEAIAAVPEPKPETGTAGLLAEYGRSGFRERSFDVVVPVTAPDPIDSTGNYYDAKAVYDAWILNPSIDTRIDFKKPPSQNTPFISANSRMQFAVKKQKVYYLAANPGTTGVMQIWLLKYASGDRGEE
jgi:hypothetical protein